MLKVDKIDIYGWEAAIRGMRNPMNSWDRMDSKFSYVVDESGKATTVATLGKNDLKLMKSLCKGGPVHSKFMRMITVTMDITAPLYWWKEYDTYKVGTVENSCSTMHKIHAKEFETSDFSHEHLIGAALPTCYSEADNYDHGLSPKEILVNTIIALNRSRDLYLAAKEAKDEARAKMFWWQMIQLLPSSYNQKRTVQLNYEVTKNIYFSRKNHKLDEWHTLCDVIKALPYAKELIIGED